MMCLIKIKGADLKVDMVTAEQVIDSETGELICDVNQKIDKVQEKN